MLIDLDHIQLEGDLNHEKKTDPLVIFAHGSGSSRKSPRNQMVAKMLNQAGIGTLLFDLLTKEEEMMDAPTAELRFNIPMLAERLSQVIEYMHRLLPKTKIALFGASTGAAAALVSAATLKKPPIAAIVSRGGRPDLAEEHLPQVKTPTLLLVGSLDTPVIEMNKGALEKLLCEKELKIVEGATHLFEESGKLEEVARLSIEWFHHHFEEKAK